MQNVGLILSTALPSIVYLRLVRYSILEVYKVDLQESREEYGRDDEPAVSDIHTHQTVDSRSNLHHERSLQVQVLMRP
jgi:hypothetical protein